MVAIQELQQEVSSLLLFRQTILTALPHLQPKEYLSSGSSSSGSSSSGSGSSTKGSHAATTWTRRRHSQQQQQQQHVEGYSSLHDHVTAATTATTNGVADSGFSTEANSNTSPRSSRFETHPAGSNPLDLAKLEANLAGINPMDPTGKQQQPQQPQQQQPQQPQQPQQQQDPSVEKELVQHLERVQHRMARLKKDEDRLLTLIHNHHHQQQQQQHQQQQPIRAQQQQLATPPADAATPTQLSHRLKMGSPVDELWHLLEEIHIRGEAMKEEMQTMQMQTLPALPALPVDAALATGSSSVPSSSSKSAERDVEHLKRKQLDAEQELNHAHERCLQATKEVEWSRKRLEETKQEVQQATVSLRRFQPSAAVAPPTPPTPPTPPSPPPPTGLNPPGRNDSPDNAHNWAPCSGGGGGGGGKKRVSFEDVVTLPVAPLAAGSATTAPMTTTASTTTTTTTTSTTTNSAVMDAPATPPGVRPSREKVAAILRLSNPVQLQRHLLRSLVDNQVLREEVDGSRAEVAERDERWRDRSRQLGEQLAALRDDNEDLRFQLEEQKIELEGTKARLRMTNSRNASAPVIASVQTRSASAQTEFHPAALLSPHCAIPRWTQTESADQLPVRMLPRVVDTSPKSKLAKLGVVDVAVVVPDRKYPGGWETSAEMDNGSSSAPSSAASSASRIPTPIKPSPASSASSASSPSPATTKLSSSSSFSGGVKRELPELPSAGVHPHKIPAKRADGSSSSSSSSITPPGGRHPQRVAQAQLNRSRDVPDAKLVRIQRGRASRLNERFDDDADDAVDVKVSPLLKTDDYYDSINAKFTVGNGGGVGGVGGSSPLDSLERSVPAMAYHYRRSREKRSYSSDSSTTPGNSLSFHS